MPRDLGLTRTLDPCCLLAQSLPQCRSPADRAWVADEGRIWRFPRRRGTGIRQFSPKGGIDEDNNRTHGTWCHCSSDRADGPDRAHGFRGERGADAEDSFIGGNLTIAGVQTCWLGSLRNQVRGSLTYVRNVTSDPDGMEINNNLMGGNMTCLNNDPAVQYGDTMAAPNLVGGFASGECGFKRRQAQPCGIARASSCVCWPARAHLGQHLEPEHLLRKAHCDPRHITAPCDDDIGLHHHRRPEQLRPERNRPPRVRHLQSEGHARTIW